MKLEEFQCGRCGSSLAFEDCPSCGGDGVYHDYEGVIAANPCGECEGSGTVAVCLSASAGWCEANPRPGREDTPTSTPESFEIDL